MTSNSTWKTLVRVTASTMCMILVGCSGVQNSTENEEFWSSPGNFIVSYGPVLEPYSSKIRNSYYLYSSAGQPLGALHGQGSWAPVALTTQGASYGYFADSIEPLGEGEGTASFLKNSPVSFYGHSPEGNLAVAIINDSDSPEFHHSSIVLHGGNASKYTVPTVPHSLAVGETAALIVGDSYEGSRHEKDLFLIRINGEVKKIDFPAGYNVNIPDFKYPHVNYLGDGLFEVLEGITEGEVTRFKSFEIQIDDDGKVTKQKITYFSMVLHSNFAVTRSLPFGENGFIDASGDVFINHRDELPPEKTGNILGFDAKEFVPVNSSTEALFGIRRNDSIEVRQWNKPEAVVARMNYEKDACSDDACGISSISHVL